MWLMRKLHFSENCVHSVCQSGLNDRSKGNSSQEPFIIVSERQIRDRKADKMQWFVSNTQLFTKHSQNSTKFH